MLGGGASSHCEFYDNLALFMIQYKKYLENWNITGQI